MLPLLFTQWLKFCWQSFSRFQCCMITYKSPGFGNHLIMCDTDSGLSHAFTQTPAGCPGSCVIILYLWVSDGCISWNSFGGVYLSSIYKHILITYILSTVIESQPLILSTPERIELLQALFGVIKTTAIARENLGRYKADWSCDQTLAFWSLISLFCHQEFYVWFTCTYLSQPSLLSSLTSIWVSSIARIPSEGEAIQKLYGSIHPYEKNVNWPQMMILDFLGKKTTLKHEWKHEGSTAPCISLVGNISNFLKKSKMSTIAKLPKLTQFTS